MYSNPKRTLSPKKGGLEVVESTKNPLVRTYLNSFLSNSDSFLDHIHPADEMYLFHKDLSGDGVAGCIEYFATGKDYYFTIKNIVNQCGYSFDKIGSFLDFASGYGRATRFLLQEMDAKKIWVSDIYKGAIDFQRDYFGVNGFYSFAEPSEVDFPRKFDVIFSGSLFSHLPEDRFEQWLETLYAHLENNGILIFSTHGESLLPPDAKRQGKGFTYLRQSESLSLPIDEYGSSFVSRKWVEDLAVKLKINDLIFVESELCRHQDVYVVSQGSLPLMERSSPLAGHVDGLSMQDGIITISGWMADLVSGAPVEKISMRLNGIPCGNAELRGERTDVCDRFGRDDYFLSGWQLGLDEAFAEKCILDNEGRLLVEAIVKNREHQYVFVKVLFWKEILLERSNPFIGYVDCWGMQDGAITISGWMADLVTGAPVEQISIHLNGIPCGNAKLSGERKDVRDHFGRDDYFLSGWQCILDEAFAGKYILGAEDRLQVEAVVKNRERQYVFAKVLFLKELIGK